MSVLQLLRILRWQNQVIDCTGCISMKLTALMLSKNKCSCLFTNYLYFFSLLNFLQSSQPQHFSAIKMILVLSFIFSTGIPATSLFRLKYVSQIGTNFVVPIRPLFIVNLLDWHYIYISKYQLLWQVTVKST